MNTLSTAIYTLLAHNSFQITSKCTAVRCRPPRGGGVTAPRIWGVVTREMPTLRPNALRTAALDLVLPPARGERPASHIEGGGTTNAPSTQSTVVSPVPHIRGAGFDGGAAARDHESLPSMAAPTPARGGVVPVGRPGPPLAWGCDRPPGGRGAASKIINPTLQL